jgi:hypothetical protein
MPHLPDIQVLQVELLGKLEQSEFVLHDLVHLL